MSSRRKSSTPCMVRVDLQDDPEAAMDVEVPADQLVSGKEQSESSSESAGKSPDPKEENLDPDQQIAKKPVENQHLKPSEQEEQSGETDQPPVVEDEEATEEKDGQDVDSNPACRRKRPRGYECKYCLFSTEHLNDFKVHVDSSHPNVILNPMYLCAVCNFHAKKFDSLTEHNESQHPGESNFKFKRTKRNNQTVLEQTIDSGDKSVERDAGSRSGDVFPARISPAATTQKDAQALHRRSESRSQRDDPIQKNPITAVNINGTVIIPEPAALQGLAHVAPMLKRPPNFNSVPKIAVPLNTTKYNPSLDDNSTLITSFNKFPYPTHAELSWLTAASKHPEEQIKVWFTTQRLKQGITWSPEEVEEARKKMFNGSIPPAHPTFTAMPATTFSRPSAQSSQQTFVHVQTAVSNGLSAAAGTNPPAGVAVSSRPSAKRSLPTYLTAVFGPESKRPIMAVAPHSGDANDRGLMAPPPPPPPKDRLPMAPPPVPAEMKRPVAGSLFATEMKRPSAAVPLMSPSSSLLSKGKVLSTFGKPKTKPVVSLPSLVFPESLTRPLIVPPPIFAPPYKNSMLFPLNAPIPPKEKHQNSHAVPATDHKVPSSPPVAPQIRRPTIIQSIRGPAKPLTQLSGHPLDSRKEQQGGEVKACYPRGDTVLTPLAEANGTSRTDGKWSQDQSPLAHNGVQHFDGLLAALKPNFHQKSSVLTQFPLLERMKGKTAEQLKVLEENFLSNSFPTLSDVDNLAGTTRLSRQEIDSWFVERRALRDNLEQALLNSMGTKTKLHQLNGTSKPSAGVGRLKSPPDSAPSAPGAAPPDGRSLALLVGDLAQKRWPCPEEFSQLDGRTGRAQLARWFNNGRLQSGGPELSELFPSNGVKGGQGPKNAPTGALQEGVLVHSSSGSGGGGKVLEVELGWLSSQRDELQGRLAGRLMQQNSVELKSGARELFGGWVEEGHSRRERKMTG
ncbi:uncharacterized protein ACO6RY_01901 [Pungitius sinensis]